MTEILFAASVAFVGYVIYVLIDEQVKSNKPVDVAPSAEPTTRELAELPVEPITSVPAKPKTTRQVRSAATPADPKRPVSPAAFGKDITATVGISAGTIWTYLKKNGPTSVAKMIKELPEDSKTLQRSIGWLAQENKIILDTVTRVETIALKD